MQWADGFGSLGVQDDQCKPGFLVRDCSFVYVCFVCVYVLQSARSLSSGGVRRALVGGNEGSPSPQTSFPFKSVSWCMFACLQLARSFSSGRVRRSLVGSIL